MEKELIESIILDLLTRKRSHRDAVVEAIDRAFLQYAIDLFKRVAEAKLQGQQLDKDWYEEFIRIQTNKDEVCTLAGINLKTVQNTRHTTKREVVLDASLEHYERLKTIIDELIQDTSGIEIQLTLKFRGVSVDLSLSETLIVVNALAVKRAQLRGSQWSALGKQLEKPLMRTLCHLFGVSQEYYQEKGSSKREVDFYFKNDHGETFKCEVKLMGRGNPESADAAFARDTDLLIADHLSDSTKQQLTQEGKRWVALSDQNWVARLRDALDSMGIPSNPPRKVSRRKIQQAIEKALQ